MSRLIMSTTSKLTDSSGRGCCSVMARGFAKSSARDPGRGFPHGDRAAVHRPGHSKFLS
jgi:hypothetical protein